MASFLAPIGPRVSACDLEDACHFLATRSFDTPPVAAILSLPPYKLQFLQSYVEDAS